MNTPLATSHESLITSVESLIKYWHMQKHKFVLEVVSPSGKTIMNAMENYLKIIGEDVEKFHG